MRAMNWAVSSQAAEWVLVMSDDATVSTCVDTTCLCFGRKTLIIEVNCTWRTDNISEQ
jgi:hypothetical protein